MNEIFDFISDYGLLFLIICVVILLFFLPSIIRKYKANKIKNDMAKWLSSPIKKSDLYYVNLIDRINFFALDCTKEGFYAKGKKNRICYSYNGHQKYTDEFQEALNDARLFCENTLFDKNKELKPEIRDALEGKTIASIEFLLQDIFNTYKIEEIRKSNSRKKNNDVSKNRTVSNAQRQRILRRDNFTCQLCGARGPGARPYPGNAELRVDHKLPFSKGGSDNDSNLWVLCHECNSGKSNNYDDSQM